MNKKMAITVMSIVAVSLVIAAATSSLMAHTPLYTVRMEQACNKMNFLPTEMNNFTYTTENGYNLNYDVSEYCSGAKPLGTDATCHPSCDDTCEATCRGLTCWSTCPDTCQETCPETCGQKVTCDWPTCDYLTCPITCACCTTSE
jgi:hypothetical protein